VCDLGLDPLAAHAVLGKDQKQTIVNANRRVDLIMEFFARLNVALRKPTAHAMALQIGIKPLSEFAVLR
jgi:hypothetical protein